MIETFTTALWATLSEIIMYCAFVYFLVFIPSYLYWENRKKKRKREKSNYSKTWTSVTGYSCPVCDSFPSVGGNMEITELKLVNLDSEPRYQWKEIHHCENCGETFSLINGS